MGSCSSCPSSCRPCCSSCYCPCCPNCPCCPSCSCCSSCYCYCPCGPPSRISGPPPGSPCSPGFCPEACLHPQHPPCDQPRPSCWCICWSSWSPWSPCCCCCCPCCCCC